MTRNDSFRQLVENARESAKSRTRALKNGPNHPVLVDEFDRERMGIAAKE